MLTTKSKPDCFLHLILKMAPLGKKLAHLTLVASHSCKKNANFMPSDAILKTVQETPIYIFVNKQYFLTFSPLY